MLHTLDAIAARPDIAEDVLMWCTKARADFYRYLAEVWRGEFLAKAEASYEKTMRWASSSPTTDEGTAERMFVHRYAAALNLSILRGDIHGNVQDGLSTAQEVVKALT